MKTKDILITIFLSIVICILYFIDKNNDFTIDQAGVAYQIYLNGEVIGLIDDSEKLYNLINDEQDEIRKKYNVDYVYPPDVFEIVKVNTYNQNYSSVEEIYSLIEERDDFTINGYTITIKYNEEYLEYNETDKIPDDFTINVLDKSVFDEAIKKYVLAFVSEDDYDDFINNQVEELTEIGQVVTNMYFLEDMTIKENYISVNEKIYTDVDELSQDLLFGPNATMDTYKVQVGDSISSISEEYKLNPREFLIANPEYVNENSMLQIGALVNVTLINPVVTFIYDVAKIEESTIELPAKTVVDKTKGYGYKEISQAGVSGIILSHETYNVINGEESQQVNFSYTETIREAVEQITVVGPGYSSVYISGNWAWPTAYPYKITSAYAYRWGKMHEGIDISGPGLGSPIYAIGDGVVVEAALEGTHSRSDGTYAVIEHDNNVYSLYAHMDSLKVKVGQKVSKGDVIGTMGETGFATGVHLHLSVSYGWPYHGSYRFINPMTIYK